MPSCWYWWMDSNHRLPAYQAGALYHWTTPVYIEGFTMQIAYPFEMVFLSWFDHKLHEPVITIILLHLGWRLGRGLNPQPPAWQAGTLTNWATESSRWHQWRFFKTVYPNGIKPLGHKSMVPADPYVFIRRQPFGWLSPLRLSIVCLPGEF